MQDDAEIAALIRQFPALAASDRPERMGGLTNRVYRIGDVVLRLPGRGTEAYIDRANEAAAARAAALAGAVLTGLALITGSLWGQPMWGTWWVWDARLTSVLVLFLFYLGYMALRASIDDEQKAGRAAAVLGLVGLINLPIVKFSVDWWNSLHQGASVFRADGPTVAEVFLYPLLLMALAYMSAFGSLWLVGIRAQVWRRRAEAAALRAARG